MKKADLRAQLQEKGLDTGGTKTELVDRLLANGGQRVPRNGSGLHRRVKNLQLLGEVHEKVERFPSGALSLDIALGGGWPRGRIVEVFGPESSGKTTVALSAIAEVQRSGGQAVFIDAEHALDRDWARTIGVDVDTLLFLQPSSGEEALDTVFKVLQDPEPPQLVVVDSVSQLTPLAEIERGMDEHTIGMLARMMSKALRKISPAASKANCTVLFINQIRFKIGGYGNPETTSGGNALKYNASMRVDVRRKELVKQSGSPDEPVGLRVQAKVVKNKCSPPFRAAMIDISFKDGICSEASLLEVATDMGIVEKNGAFFYFQDGENRVKLGQGKLRACSFLQSDVTLRDKIEEIVRSSKREDPASCGQLSEEPKGGTEVNGTKEEDAEDKDDAEKEQELNAEANAKTHIENGTEVGAAAKGRGTRGQKASGKSAGKSSGHK